MRKIASRLRLAVTHDGEGLPSSPPAFEPRLEQQFDLFGVAADPVPAPITAEQEQRRLEFEDARLRNERATADHMLRFANASDEVELAASNSSRTRRERLYSLPLPVGFVDEGPNSDLSLSPTRSSRLPSGSDLATRSHISLRRRHSVSFALPATSPLEPARVASAALSESLSSDSLFPPTIAGSESPRDSRQLELDGLRGSAAARVSSRRSVPFAPTSVVRWKVDHEKEYELSKSVGKDVFAEALEDDNLIKEFQAYLAACRGDAALLSLYIDLRTFSAQSSKLRESATKILSAYFNEHSPSRLQLPISLRGPILHSLAPLSSTLLSLETAEQDLFSKIHQDYFEGFTQERLTAMAADWLAQLEETKDGHDWSHRGLGAAFCLTNPRMYDNPMVLVTNGFAKLTGYASKEIIGLNCRVFQGPCTSESSYAAIREAVYSERRITKLVLNYRRDGEPFYNLIQILPIKNRAGDLQFFLGGVCDATDLLHPFSTKPPSNSPTRQMGTDNVYSRIMLVRSTSRKILFASPQVGEYLGSRSIIGLDLLELFKRSAISVPPLPTEPFNEPVHTSTAAQIAAAIRQGDEWKGFVEMNCDRSSSNTSDDRSVENGTKVTCVLRIAHLRNEKHEPQMLVVV
ncbi:uncharacterized protein JCM15063_004590 [Sporobolomyces koalae]|uniref:uncharacterized protein n=1 Tax=Sporobolomyces koalae TaxID=500713 RepID=UPI00316C07A1